MKPLPLTPFEELMLWEDRPAYPFDVFARIRFDGRLHRESWEGAMSQALQLHPLLRSKIELRRGRPSWIETEDHPPIEWLETDKELTGDFPRRPRLDLFSEIGLRCVITAGIKQTDVILQFQHACCDGAGFISFLNDLFVAYALRRGAESPDVKLSAYNRSRLPERNRFGLTWWKLAKMIPAQLHGLQGARQFLGRQPAQVVAHPARPNDAAPPERYPATARLAWSPEATSRLRTVSKRLQVTLNELLARDLFVALCRWRRESHLGSDQEWIRMMIPMNMRLPEDRDLSAANIVSSIFLDRKGEDAADPQQLLTSIHDELELIKRNQLGFTFQFSLKLCRMLPGGIRKAARDDKCSVSCIFTNVSGMPSQIALPKSDGRIVAGDVRLEHYQFVVPIRPYCDLCFCAHQYAGQQVLDLHYNPDAISADQAQRLIELLAAQIDSTLAPAAMSTDLVPQEN